MLWRFDNENDRRVMRAKATSMALTPVLEIVGILQHSYTPEEFIQASKFLEEIKNELNAAIDEKITELQGKGRKKS